MIATKFAPADRAAREEIERQLETICSHPALQGVMALTSGLLMILNGHRQILGLNTRLLDSLGFERVEELIGLRPGEAMNCVHSNEEPGGCGTTVYCRTCGAAIAIVTALAEKEPAERKCAAEVKRDGRVVQLSFRVSAVPIRVDHYSFILLFMQDITNEEKWASMERVFLHDLSNILTSLQGAVELASAGGGKACDQRLMEVIKDSTYRILEEVALQRLLVKGTGDKLHALKHTVSLINFLKSVRKLSVTHPMARGKSVELRLPSGDIQVFTDPCLLQRVIGNMLLNALEASEPGDEVRLGFNAEGRGVSIFVWNRQAIPGDVQLRVFQRFFSTKEGQGRGLGTYSMKLLGEEFLGGKVAFRSSTREGTTFSIELPCG